MNNTIQTMPEENTSGMGKFHEVPGGVEGWSWGAFFWTWLWAIANRTWVGLFTLLPLATGYGISLAGPIGGHNTGWMRPALAAFALAVTLALHYLLGMNGRKWAWQNRRWRDVEHFNRVQRGWSIAAFVGMMLLAVGSGSWAYHLHHVDTGIGKSIEQANEIAWKVGGFMERNRKVPASLEDAGVTAPYGPDIADVTLSANGQLQILTTFPEFDGKRFTLAPSFNDYGQVEWRCMAGEIPRMSMPKDCRFDIEPKLRFPN